MVKLSVAKIKCDEIKSGDIIVNSLEQPTNTFTFFKLHLRVFLLLKVSNIFHCWPLCDFDHI